MWMNLVMNVPKSVYMHVGVLQVVVEVVPGLARVQNLGQDHLLRVISQDQDLLLHHHHQSLKQQSPQNMSISMNVVENVITVDILQVTEVIVIIVIKVMTAVIIVVITASIITTTTTITIDYYLFDEQTVRVYFLISPHRNSATLE